MSIYYDNYFNDDGDFDNHCDDDVDDDDINDYDDNDYDNDDYEYSDDDDNNNNIVKQDMHTTTKALITMRVSIFHNHPHDHHLYHKSSP